MAESQSCNVDGYTLIVAAGMYVPLAGDNFAPYTVNPDKITTETGEQLSERVTAITRVGGKQLTFILVSATG